MLTAIFLYIYATFTRAYITQEYTESTNVLIIPHLIFIFSLQVTRALEEIRLFQVMASLPQLLKDRTEIKILA